MGRAAKLRWGVYAGLALGCAWACAPLQNDAGSDGDFTSLPTDGAPTPGGGASVDGNNAANSPNTAGQGNDQAGSDGASKPAGDGNGGGASGGQPNATGTPSVDPCVVAILSQTNTKAVYGVGFALEAIASPGYCVGAVDKGLAAGTTLKLLPCANVLEQQWGWSRGQLALNKRMCATGPAANGANLTLQECKLSSEQNWALPLGTDVLQRMLASTQTVQGWSVDTANPTGVAVIGQVATTQAGMRVRVGALPQTDGVRVHAKVNGTDLCLADVTGGPKFAGCSDDAGQVWRMVADQWRSALGNCLVGDATAGTVSLGACTAQPADTARWALIGGFLAFGGAPSSLVLDVDGSKSAPKLSAPAGLAPAYAFGAPTGTF